MGVMELWHIIGTVLPFFCFQFPGRTEDTEVQLWRVQVGDLSPNVEHYSISSKTSTRSPSFRIGDFWFAHLHPFKTSCDWTLQTGRRRDEWGRGPGLCTAAQKPQQPYSRSHESPGDAQHRSFNQSPQHLRVLLTQWGEYLTHRAQSRKEIYPLKTRPHSEIMRFSAKTCNLI